MNSEEDQQEKGLFTFYKEQQTQDQPSKQTKKYKKSKNKKSKKTLSKKKQKSPLRLKLLDLQEPTQSMTESKVSKDAYSSFLKNVLNKPIKGNQSCKQASSLQIKLKTEPIVPFNTINSAKGAILSGKASLSESQNSLQIVPEDNCNQIQSSKKINDILTNWKQRQQQQTSRQQELLSLRKKFNLQQLNQQTHEHKKIDRKSFLERLKYLQVNHKSNLITDTEKTLKKSQTQDELHYKSKNYFKNLMSNFYIHSQLQNQYAYQVLRDKIKLPTLEKTHKHLKTQDSSQRLSNNKKLQIPIRALSYHKKQGKIKRTDIQHRQLYKFNIIAELTQNIKTEQKKSPISTINMNNNAIKSQYTLEKEWEQRRRAIKCRLGIQI